MKKLRFVSVIIVLLLFCPFIKQCDGFTRKSASELELSSKLISDKDDIESKTDFAKEIKMYFSEKSENVFDLSSQVGIYFDNKKNEDIGLRGLNGVLFSILFSISLILSSIIAAIRIFTNKLEKTNWFYISNISFTILIVISNMFIFLDRFGQIKIGFYLLLLSNFYMLYLLKQKKEQIL
ncbi:hypothetical protein [Flavobacterium sp.]|uniref:hypothetical protein n=1 Tax=Flavobacterium sp. TaxID=239 RepID=UPI0033412EF7